VKIPSSNSTSQELETDPAPLTADERTKTAAWVNNQFRKCKDARAKQEKQWYINLAFHQGRQNVQSILTPGQGRGTRLQTPNAPYWRARPVINKLRVLIRKELAKLCSSKPTAHVVPASSEDKDLFAARAAESLWESIAEDKKIQTVIRRSQFWARIIGNGFIKCYWDEQKVDNSNDQVGDICIESVTPWHVFVPDLEEQDIENQAYVIHVSIKSVEFARLAYGDMVVNEIKATTKTETIIDTGFLNLINADLGMQDQDSVEIIEVWIKPNNIEMFPDGGIVTMVGGQIAQAWKGWPYKSKLYPFIKFDNIDTGGFYSESVITDLIGLQREYNRTHGQIIEAKNRMAKPQLLAPKGSINPAQITTEPGQVILYKPGFNPPTPLPLQPLPNYVLDELDRIQQDINDISSQHEVSKGATPPGVTAATAISYLQEQDDTVLSASLESMEHGVEKMAKLTLSYVEQYWTTQRMVKVTGTDGAFDVIMLKGADIEGNTDIRIEKDSALPTSRAAKQAFIMDLMKMGFIDPNKGLEVMEIGGVNKIYESIHVDARQAQRENLRMQNVPEETVSQFVEAQATYNETIAQGMPPVDPTSPMGEMLPPPPPPIPVNSWDNHMAHIEIHNNFRKSQTFEALPEPTQQIFEAHVQQHMMMSAPPPMPGQMPGEPTNMPPEEGGPPPNLPSQEGMTNG